MHEGGNMPRKNQQSKKQFYTKSINIGLVLSIMILFVLSFFNDIVSGEIFLHDAMPHYGQIMALTPEDFLPTSQAEETEETTYTVRVYSPIIEGLIGLNDVEFTYDFSTGYANLQEVIKTLDPHTLVIPDIEAMRNPETLRNAMYIVNNLTLFVPEKFNVDEFVAFDARANPISMATGDPVVLIFHTHSTEMFVDSNPLSMNTGIVGIGAYLTDILNAKGIPTMHYTRRFDMVDGVPQIQGAYERLEPYIARILEENPTIEVIIDMHRDGLPETAPRLVTYIDGKPTARLMFVNGLSTRNVNGVATPINHLPNPNLAGNLAFSFQMQAMLNDMHPDLNRRIFLNAFRYSTHFLPKSLLLEVGDQRSTIQEAKNAMHPFAEALASILKGGIIQ